MRVLVIDNYDSFTYNLVQVLGTLGADIRVVRNDAQSAADALAIGPDRVVISPGPKGPADAGISNDVIRGCADKRIPLLGVCLGHQCLAFAYGGRVTHGSSPFHGKTSLVSNDGRGVFTGLPRRFAVARYHSLVVDEHALPAGFVATAHTEDGVLMGLRHEALPLEGVQFHPESFMTAYGPDLMRNFFEGRCGGAS
ncbi:aminodeoxychorismate/anthranilate synthase component II [bacterium]|nr:aminodeoxychorismate/anthranilate synthase component II [bacterium]